MKLDNWLTKRAQSCPDRMALTAGGTVASYAELEAEATWVARRLAAHGVRRGARAAVTMHGRREQVVLLHALMKLGAIIMPLSPKLPEPERHAVLETEAPVIDLDDAALLTQTEADLPLLGEHDLEDPHCRILTSGSSGTPVAVELTYGNHLWSAVGSAFNIGIDPSDTWLCCLPLAHVGGLSILLRSVIYGTGVVLHEEFSTERVGEEVASGAVSMISVVPTMLIRLLEEGVDLSSLRAILVGGGPVPEAPLAKALDAGFPVMQTYGLTEASSQVTTLAASDMARKAGSAGRPLLTTHLKIADGEILIQGPTVAPGLADADGWLRTGDRGWIDEEGFLWVDGRVDDLIVTGGENVSPAEVEGALLEHPAVGDAAVVGRPDPQWQQAVVALVVAADGTEVEPEELRRHCAERLAPCKVPKLIELTDSLPRTSAGKLRRHLLQ